MLQRLNIRNFKSFEDDTIIFAPVTVFFGRNASGKSNVFDAIRFLQGAADNLTVPEVLRERWEGSRRVWPGVRGGLGEAARSGHDTFALTTTWRRDGESLEHFIEVSTSGPPQVIREHLKGSDSGRYLFDTHADTVGFRPGPQDGGAITVAFKRLGGGGRSPTRTLSASRSILGQLTESVQYADVNPKTYECCDWIQSRLSSARFLDITPARMRDYVPQHIQNMGDDGQNLSAVLWKICQDPEQKSAFVDWLSELIAPELATIDFINTELGDVMVVLVEESGARISARSMSDGTLRFLGELTALWTAQEDSLVLIEEIENGLHPNRAKLLVELLETMSSHRKVQVLATTHSPAIIENLPAPLRDKVVLFGRVPKTNATKAVRLSKLEGFRTLFEKRGMDYLMQTGWFEKAI